MIYKEIVKGIFISRPNRFIANVEVEGEIVICHVKNTGRCKELLIKGETVILEINDIPNRKTKYDLIAVYKGDVLVNIDSQAPNKLFAEWVRGSDFFKDIVNLRHEMTYLNSRFDFYIETSDKKIFVEVKGVTLEGNCIASFPDAPTERGVKHVDELVELKKQGYGAAIFFIIQMKGIREFRPNDITHRAFGDALRRACQSGVGIFAYDCVVTPDSITVDQPVEVKL